MSELEQRLVKEWSKLAAQYAQDQKQLSGQVERLEEQMQQLAEQYEQERKAHMELTSILGEHIEHVGKLSANYRTLTDDLTELFR